MRTASWPGVDAGFLPEGPAEVAVIVVTQDDADAVRAMLPELRREAREVRLRVVVVDAGSRGAVRAMLSEHPDIIVVPGAAGGVRGAAVRRGVAHAGDAEAVLTLPPGQALDPGAIRRLRGRLRADPRIAAVAPMLRTADGRIRRTAGRGRSGTAYAWGRPVHTATGGVLLVAADALEDVGGWGTHPHPSAAALDVQRRLRASGRTVWFEPAAGATARLAAPAARPRPFPGGSIIIPAHDEAAVIARTLAPLAPLAAAGAVEVIVVCNGCSDDTAERARAFAGVRVVETRERGKAAALNLGDEAASRWPRVYLDADIRTTPDALAPVLRTLADGPALAGRPSFVTDVTGASAAVRAYQRARARMPALSTALWGAGVYALSRDGHARLGCFPALTADDLYVDRLFAPQEKALPRTDPVVVASPRTATALLAVLTRAQRGPAEQSVDSGRSTLAELVRTIRGPLSAVDAVVFAAFALAARRRGRGAAPTTAWERDESSRRGNGRLASAG